MSVLNLEEWGAYRELAPFGEERADIRTGQLVRTFHEAVNLIIETLGGKAPYDKQQTAPECALRFGDTPEYLGPGPTRSQSSEDFGAIMRSIADSYVKAK